MKIAVISEDSYLIRKIELELIGIAEISESKDTYDVLIYDADSGIAPPDFNGKTVILSRCAKDGCVLLPIKRGKLAEIIKSDATQKIILSETDRSVIFKNKRIKLTSHEYSLLSLLLSCRDYTPRTQISQKVFGGATDGLINIYIHYLREKLETDGEKVILSSRKYGYKINEKYLEDGAC